ncbi:MAG: choice-of-anchor C family protein [Luteolibacter sp.]
MSPKILIIASAALWGPSAFAANIIDSIYGVGSGSFENPGHTIATFETYQAGSIAITGWTVNTVNIDWVSSNLWNASDGNYLIDMNGDPGDAGSFQTVIPTTIGSTYRVSFDISGFVTPNSSSNPKTMETQAGGVTTFFSLDVSVSTFPEPYALPFTLPWTSRSFDFVATSTSSTVIFASLIPNEGSGMFLDNVSIEAVPESSSVALLAAGAVGLALRRKRQIPAAEAF